MQLERFFERLGIRYFNYLYKQIKADDYIHIEGLPSDQVLQVIVRNITQSSVIIAFLVGALTTVPAVIIEMRYKESLAPTDYWLWLSLATILMLIVELGILYWLGLHAVHSLANITGHRQIEPDPTIPLEYQVESMLVRTALELPDPIIHYLGIDPQKHLSQKKMLLMSLLYKAKVILTSLLLKLLLRKVAARFGVRVGFAWVAIPVTAFWDAWVMHRVITDAKLRLFGYQLSRFIIHHIFTQDFLDRLPPEARLTAIRAVASVMVLANRYHPNNLLLLIRLSDNLNIQEEGDYDDWERFETAYHSSDPETQRFLRALLVIAAAFDGKLSKKERLYLPRIFGKESDVYFTKIEAIITMLKEGELHKVAKTVEALLTE